VTAGQGIEHATQARTTGDTETDASLSSTLPESTGARTLTEYAALVSGKCCRWCGAQLKGQVQHYDHSGGWEVSGFQQRQWLYTTCPRCQYQWNLGKLGIPR